MTDAWDGMSVEFRMSETAIIAIMEHGAAVQAKGLDIIVQDGRVPVMYGPDDDHDEPRRRLEYKCMVCMVDAEPEYVQDRQGIVHIDGVHENGDRLTIRGVGWVGKDQDGNIDIVFDELPEMIFYEVDDDDTGGTNEQIDEAGNAKNIVPLRRSHNQTRVDQAQYDRLIHLIH